MGRDTKERSFILLHTLTPMVRMWNFYSIKILTCDFFKLEKENKLRYLLNKILCKNGINKTIMCKVVNIFLSISFNTCYGCLKTRLYETVLLSTHNICFGYEIFFYLNYPFLSEGLNVCGSSFYHFLNIPYIEV